MDLFVLMKLYEVKNLFLLVGLNLPKYMYHSFV